MGLGELFNERGLRCVVPEGSFFDIFPHERPHDVTLGTWRVGADALRRRRFRVILIVDTAAEGYVENDWLGPRAGGRRRT